VLLRNRENVTREADQIRLEEILAANKAPMTVYVLKDDLYLTTAYVRHAGINFDTSAVSFANGYFPGSGQQSMTAVAAGMRHRF